MHLFIRPILNNRVQVIDFEFEEEKHNAKNETSSMSTCNEVRRD